MPTTYYCNVGGSTLSQVSGGVRRDFLTDAIGSITATVNEHGNIENTYRYKPYGGTLAKTGAGADPRLGWREAFVLTQNSLDLLDEHPRTYSTLLGLRISLPFSRNAPVMHDVVVERYLKNHQVCKGGEFSVYFKDPLPYEVKGKGAIVQRVKITWEIQDCKGNVLDGGTIFQFEAWEFKNGKFEPPKEESNLKAADAYHFSLGGGNCKRFTYKSEGTLGYYHGFEPRKAGFVWDKHNGLLVSSPDLGLPQGQQRRSYQLKGDCCLTTKQLVGKLDYFGVIPIHEWQTESVAGPPCQC